MSDQYVRVCFSDDGGRNWSDWEVCELGEVGEYGERVIVTRQGSTINRVYKVRVTSPRKRDLMGAVALIQGTVG
jgi:hypothetical protein